MRLPLPPMIGCILGTLACEKKEDEGPIHDYYFEVSYAHYDYLDGARSVAVVDHVRYVQAKFTESFTANGPSLTLDEGSFITHNGQEVPYTDDFSAYRTQLGDDAAFQRSHTFEWVNGDVTHVNTFEAETLTIANPPTTISASAPPTIEWTGEPLKEGETVFAIITQRQITGLPITAQSSVTQEVGANASVTFDANDFLELRSGQAFLQMARIGRGALEETAKLGGSFQYSFRTTAIEVNIEN